MDLETKQNVFNNLKPTQPMNWSLSKKILFRLLFSYLFLYTMSIQFVLSDWLDSLWESLTLWFGNQVLVLSEPLVYNETGSGDSTYDYILNLLMVIIAVVVATIWSLLDRKRESYQKLLDYLVILVRYYLAYQMIQYGFAKVFCLQFPEPSLHRLQQPLGEYSPMGLAWAFVGYSKGFEILTGSLELLGGTLLLFRRIQTLGALVTFVVMSNVVALNFFYDIPVKLLSSQLTLMCLFLMLMDRRRLINVFFKNRTAEPLEIRPVFTKKKWRIAKNVVKWQVIPVFIGYTIYIMFGYRAEMAAWFKGCPTCGDYTVTSFVHGNLVEEQKKECDQWQSIQVWDEQNLSVETYCDDNIDFEYIVYPDSNQLILNYPERSRKFIFDYSFEAEKGIRFDGRWRKQNLRVICDELKAEDFPLMQGEFRWINEFPDNR